MSSCLDYSVRLWVTDLDLSAPVSVFEFAQIVLQVYRDKNLRLNLDLRTPSLSNLYLDLRTPSLSSLCLNLDLRTLSFSSLRLNLDLRTPSLSRVNIRNTPRGYIFFSSPLFYPFAFGFI